MELSHVVGIGIGVLLALFLILALFHEAGEASNDNQTVTYKLHLKNDVSVRDVMVRIESVVLSQDGEVERILITDDEGTYERNPLAPSLQGIGEVESQIIRISMDSSVPRHKYVLNLLRAQFDRNGGSPTITLRARKARIEVADEIREVLRPYTLKTEAPDFSDTTRTPQPDEASTTGAATDDPSPQNVARHGIWHTVSNQPLAVQIVGGIVATLAATLIITVMSKLISG